MYKTPPPVGQAVMVILGNRMASFGHNLRIALAYGSKHGVARVVIWPLPKSEGALCVQYANGATCSTRFASYSVLVDWCKARRSWPPAEILSEF